MKKILFVSWLYCGLLPALHAQSNLRCGTGHHLPPTETYFETQHAIHQWMQDNPSELMANRTVVTIPVVVHVIWSKVEENIPDEQIATQITVLNKDFRKSNIEIPGIPPVFQNLIADVEFEFCLAAKDPAGNPTNGITRTFTNNSVGIGATSAIHYTGQGGKDAWDPAHYLNIWVAKFAGGVGGVAAFPGEGPPAEDGVEINYLQFGTLNTSPPYHLGRTCTHEIGHYFNLDHIWGPGILDCCEDDFVADTPPACETYLNECPVHPVVSCSGPDMFMNYMFYTDDACMGMFTIGQKMRMLATLNTFRSGLLESDACMPVLTSEGWEKKELLVMPNPVTGELRFEIKSRGGGNWGYGLYDVTGKEWASGKTASNRIETLPGVELPAGIYFLKVGNGEVIFGQKVLVR